MHVKNDPTGRGHRSNPQKALGTSLRDSTCFGPLCVKNPPTFH